MLPIKSGLFQKAALIKLKGCGALSLGRITIFISKSTTYKGIRITNRVRRMVVFKTLAIDDYCFSKAPVVKLILNHWLPKTKAT